MRPWIWSNYSDLTKKKCSWGFGKSPCFMEILDWWNIIIWPDGSVCWDFFSPTTTSTPGGSRGHEDDEEDTWKQQNAVVEFAHLVKNRHQKKQKTWGKDWKSWRERWNELRELRFFFCWLAIFILKSALFGDLKLEWQWIQFSPEASTQYHQTHLHNLFCWPHQDPDDLPPVTKCPENGSQVILPLFFISTRGVEVVEIFCWRFGWKKILEETCKPCFYMFLSQQFVVFSLEAVVSCLEENSARTVVGKIGWTCGTCHWSQNVQPWPVHDIGTGGVLGSRWWVFLIQPFVGGCFYLALWFQICFIFTPV